jgi:hypothetical protein
VVVNTLKALAKTMQRLGSDAAGRRGHQILKQSTVASQTRASAAQAKLLNCKKTQSEGSPVVTRQSAVASRRGNDQFAGTDATRAALHYHAKVCTSSRSCSVQSGMALKAAVPSGPEFKGADGGVRCFLGALAATWCR